MKKTFAFLITFSGLGLYAQIDGNTKPADFAIVTLTAKTNREADFGSKYFCVAKFSDGKEFSLEDTIGLPGKPKSAIHRDEMDGAKIKVFDYFYKKGYELMAITDVPPLPIRFYFKRKGL